MAEPAPAPTPTQQWASFARFLDEDSLTTAMLHRWLGHPVYVADLQIAPAAVMGAIDGQRRVLTLVAVVGGRALPICRAESEVRLDLLPLWARAALTRTRLPLGRTLYRTGAVRNRTLLSVLDPSPLGLDGAAATATGTFRLPGGDGHPVAQVREAFTGHLLEHRALHSEAGHDRAIDDLDQLLLTLLLRRRELALQTRLPAGRTPPAYPVADELLRVQLCDLLGHERGAALFTGITGHDRLWRAARQPPAADRLH